ncbi:MAG: PPE family protein, partial [Mycobacterium sp.]
GALGVEAVRSPTTTSGGAGGAPIGGMPVGHAAGGSRGSHEKSEQPATVRVVEARL